MHRAELTHNNKIVYICQHADLRKVLRDVNKQIADLNLQNEQYTLKLTNIKID